MSENNPADSSGQGPSLAVAEVVRLMHAGHARSLFAYLLGILRDRASVEDVLQQTFHKFQQELIKQESTQADDGPLPADSEKIGQLHAGWLFRVAYNEAMQLRRQEQGKQRHAAGIRFFQKALRNNEQDALVEAEQSQMIREAVKKLEPELQIIIQKRIFEEKKFRDIASELRLPLGTVLTRMSRALTKLKSALGRQMGDET